MAAVLTGAYIIYPWYRAAPPLAIALVIGTYSHFLSPGTDNILRMPSGDLRLSFQISAILLVFLEALGCWVGIRIFAYSRIRRRDLR
jgi:hypothetical protein